MESNTPPDIEMSFKEKTEQILCSIKVVKYVNIQYPTFEFERHLKLY